MISPPQKKKLWVPNPVCHPSYIPPTKLLPFKAHAASHIWSIEVSVPLHPQNNSVRPLSATHYKQVRCLYCPFMANRVRSQCIVDSLGPLFKRSWPKFQSVPFLYWKKLYTRDSKKLPYWLITSWWRSAEQGWEGPWKGLITGDNQMYAKPKLTSLIQFVFVFLPACALVALG